MKASATDALLHQPARPRLMPALQDEQRGFGEPQEDDAENHDRRKPDDGMHQARWSLLPPQRKSTQSRTMRLDTDQGSGFQLPGSLAQCGKN